MTSSSGEPFLYDVSRLVWRRWAGRRPTGIDRACLAYLEHFAGRSLAVIQHPRMRRIFHPRASRLLFALLSDPAADFRRRFVQFLGLYGWGSQPPGEGRLYLNIGHTGLDAAGYREWIGKADVRPVYLVHDLIPITHPDYCRAGESERHVSRIRTVLASAAGIIVNSRSTLVELQAFARDQQLDCPPAQVAWLGTTPFPPPPNVVDAPCRATFLILGTIEGRKNHLLLLNLWPRLVARLGDAAPRLLVIGQRGWKAEPALNLLDCSEALRGHVIELARCSDDELARHLVSARALLFPSLAEGFGLPLVEALSMGVPVIASDLPVFREIAGELPDFVAPTDEAAWEALIIDYTAAGSAARRAQCGRIRGYRAPGWKDHLRTVEQWLQTL